MKQKLEQGVIPQTIILNRKLHGHIISRAPISFRLNNELKQSSQMPIMRVCELIKIIIAFINFNITD